MHGINSTRSRATSARGIAALFAMVAAGLGLMARPAESAPFAYVTNAGANTVSVIDTATNTVVATVPVGANPFGVAVTPDGKHAYITSGLSPGTVSVIDTATNLIVGTPIPVENGPIAVAVAPDGKHAYVVNENSTVVSVITTVDNKVVTTITVGQQYDAIAVTPAANMPML